MRGKSAWNGRIVEVRVPRCTLAQRSQSDSGNTGSQSRSPMRVVLRSPTVAAVAVVQQRSECLSWWLAKVAASAASKVAASAEQAGAWLR